MPSTSAPATEASNSPSDSPECPPEPWLTLSGTPTQRPLSWHGWRRRTWIRRLSGLTCAPSTLARGLDEWTSSLPGSPANHSRAQASSVALTTSVGSGLPSDGSSVTWDPASCSWRTSPDLFGQGYLTSSPTLPASGSMRSGVCSLRPRWGHRTSANGSGSWPTPTATDCKASGNGQKAIEAGWAGTLTDQAVRQWPTPTAHDHKDLGGPPSQQERHSPGLATIAAHSGRQVETTTPDGPTGSQPVDLNPRFVEALMGVPPNWLTPSTSVETGSYRRWLQLHSSSSPAGST